MWAPEASLGPEQCRESWRAWAAVPLGGCPGRQNVPTQLSRAREPGLEATGRGLWRMVALQTVRGA